MSRTNAPSSGSIAVRTPLALRGQRIGLLGGSFNPPHAGHRLISTIAIARLRLDRVWWIVTPGNPLKAGRALAPLDERVAQARTLASDTRITVTGFEAQLASPYTVDTLSFLVRRHPGVHFVWLMGADCLAEFHRWHRWRHIFALMPIAVVDRPGWHLKALASPAAHAFQRSRRTGMTIERLATTEPPAWAMLTGPLSPLSSTAIRAQRDIG